MWLLANTANELKTFASQCLTFIFTLFHLIFFKNNFLCSIVHSNNVIILFCHPKSIIPAMVNWSAYILTCLCYQKRMSGDTQTARCCHATVKITVMVHAWSHSFQRTIIGQLRRSLWWWPPHHCSVPPLPPATFVGLISDLCRNFSSTPIPPKNLYSYHFHYQPAPCAIYRSTTRAHHAPHTFHVIGQSYCAYTSSRGHGFRSPQGLARIWVSILQHPSEYKSFCYMFHSAIICSPKYLLICLCLYLYRYSSCSM